MHSRDVETDPVPDRMKHHVTVMLLLHGRLQAV